MQSCDMMAVGIDTVRKRLACLGKYEKVRKIRLDGHSHSSYACFCPHVELTSYEMYSTSCTFTTVVHGSDYLVFTFLNPIDIKHFNFLAARSGQES